MTGKQVRNLLRDNDIQQKTIYEALGMSQQSFSNMLISDNVKSGLLEDIVRVLGLKISFFYPNDFNTPQVVNKINRPKAHNMSTGSGSITENQGTDSETVRLLLKQNQELIEILKSKL